MLQGNQIRLRAVALDQVLPRFEWFTDAEFTKLYLGKAQHAVQYRLMEAEVLYAMNSTALSGHFELAIQTVLDERYVGNVFLRNINWVSRSAEFSMFLGCRELWGKGLGQEASRLMLDHAFAELGLHRVWLTAFSFNPRALACFERVGFRREGIFRDAVYCDGAFHDTVVMGMLEQEYAPGRRP